MIEYTSEQSAIIQHDSGHAIVSAVAGSGKTQTLIGRIIYLLKQGMDPSRILVVMFNKSAKNQFEVRLERALNSSTEDYDAIGQVRIKTFHALGYGLIRSLERMKLLSKGRLIPHVYQFDQLVKSALEKTLKFCQADEEITAELIEQYSNMIALYKSEPVSFSQNSHFIKLDRKEREKVEVFCRFFESARQQKGLRTFDDLIFEPTTIVKKIPKVAAQFSDQFDVIIVDEYQDINQAQQYLLKMLAGVTAEVMAVGDVDQTIYEWRGSKPYYMLKGFSKDFKGLTTYPLSQTFRYGHRLSLAANYVIQHNKQRVKGLCVSNRTAAVDTMVEVRGMRELPVIVAELKRSVECGEVQSYVSVAVLVRKYSLATLFELECLKQDIPYEIEGGASVLNSPLLHSMLGYLYLVDNAKAMLSLPMASRKKMILSMLSYPSLFLVRTQLDGIVSALTENVMMGESILYGLSLEKRIKPYQAERIRSRAFLWSELLSYSGNQNCHQVLSDVVVRLKLQSYLEKSNRYSSQQSLGQICGDILAYALIQNLSIIDFIKQFQRLKHTAQTSQGVGADKVRIMSIHRAKGLEWQNVILLDMTEKSIFGAKDPEADVVESERRLMYVGMTRAKEYLMIVAGNDHAKRRKWDTEGVGAHPEVLRPSNSVRFVYELNLPTCHLYAEALMQENVQKPLIKQNKTIADKYWAEMT